jgi:hypothetical protein
MAPARLLSFLLAVLIFFASLRYLGIVVGPLVAAWRLGPKGSEHPIGNVAGWGEAFDPAGDCDIQKSGTDLRLAVPGTLHDLSVEHAQLGAPRVLREVTGDFDAEVAVPSGISPGGERTSGYALPYHGAGLLIWLDRDNYIRLERAAILRDGNVYPYVNFERRTNAIHNSSKGQWVSDGPIMLRLERRGSHVSASYREDGEDWVRFPGQLAVRGWGDALRVGVAAVNTSTVPLNAVLRNLRISELDSQGP